MKIFNERIMEKGDSLFDLEYSEEELEMLINYAVRKYNSCEADELENVMDNIINWSFISILKEYISKEEERNQDE